MVLTKDILKEYINTKSTKYRVNSLLGFRYKKVKVPHSLDKSSPYYTEYLKNGYVELEMVEIAFKGWKYSNRVPFKDRKNRDNYHDSWFTLSNLMVICFNLDGISRYNSEIRNKKIDLIYETI